MICRFESHLQELREGFPERFRAIPITMLSLLPTHLPSSTEARAAPSLWRTGDSARDRLSMLMAARAIPAFAAMVLSLSFMECCLLAESFPERGRQCRGEAFEAEGNGAEGAAQPLQRVV